VAKRYFTAFTVTQTHLAGTFAGYTAGVDEPAALNIWGAFCDRGVRTDDDWRIAARNQRHSYAAALGLARSRSLSVFHSSIAAAIEKQRAGHVSGAGHMPYEEVPTNLTACWAISCCTTPANPFEIAADGNRRSNSRKLKRP